MIVMGALVGISLFEIAARAIRIQLALTVINNFERYIFAHGEATNDADRQKAITNAALCLCIIIFLVSAGFGVAALLFIAPAMVFSLSNQEFLFYSLATLISLPYIKLRPSIWRFFKKNQATNFSNLPAGGSRSRYPFASRLLHWLILEPEPVRKISFWIETIYVTWFTSAGKQRLADNAPVYVCGLARSGTTIVLDVLHKTGVFASTSYADMPFVLAPNLWKSITVSAKGSGRKLERAHADGLLIDQSSPESFEEVFWRTYTERNSGPGLGYCSPTATTLEKFKRYQELVIFSKSAAFGHNNSLRYLSKNNNNVLRLEVLLEDLKARAVIVVRDPLATAWSLFKQHKRFCDLFSDDHFDLAYLRWLGHHEFGAGHLPFDFSVEALRSLKPLEPNYWLQYWISVYDRLVHVATNPRVCVVVHDHLCADSINQIDRILQFLDIVAYPQNLATMVNTTNRNHQVIDQYFDPNLAKYSADLFEKIISLSTKKY